LTEKNEIEYIALDLNEYQTGLNKLLSDNGFEERFVLERTFAGNPEDWSGQVRYWDTLVITNETKAADSGGKEFDFYKDAVAGNKRDGQGEELPADHISNNKIILIDERETVLYYMGYREYIPRFDNLEENLEYIFEIVKQILKDKKVIFFKKCRKGVIKFSPLLDFDPNSFQYSKKGRKFLSGSDIRIETWSGNVTDNMKLFIIGEHYTKMPAIKKARERLNFKRVSEISENEIIWQGESGKMGNVIPLAKACGLFLLFATMFCCLGFIRSWLTFVIFESVVVFSLAVSFVIFSLKNKNFYIVTDKKIFIRGWYSYGYEDIFKVRIKYGRNKKRGTIKVKVRNQGLMSRLMSFGNHLYSVPEPEKIYNLILERMKAHEK